MLLIGLTGSIATGKSTVSSLLRQPPYSLPIIDADLLARKVVEPGTRGYRKIVQYFGPTTPDLLQEDPDGKFKEHGAPLNRPALGKRVFGDSEERERDRKILGTFVHPYVRWEMAKAVLYYYLTGHWAVVLDIPLLFESGLDIFCGTVVVVAVSDPAIQMKRLQERDPHLSSEDAENRVKSQGDVREKAKRAETRSANGRGFVVWNDGGKDDLQHELERVMEGCRRVSPRWWAWMLLFMPPLAGTLGAWSVLRAWWERRKWQAAQDKERAKLGGPVDGAQLFYRDYRPTRSTETSAPNTALPALSFCVAGHPAPSSSSLSCSHSANTTTSAALKFDRRGFGNSDWRGPQTGEDIDYDMFAEDVAFIVESLNLDSLVFPGASMGCREGLPACYFSSTVP